MTGSFEILILLVIVASLAYRFFTLIGKQTPLAVPPELQKAAEDAYADFTRQNRLTFAKETEEPLKRILSAFPFSVPDFVIGAKKAFEMVLTAFAGADSAVLKGLLSPALFRSFDSEIKKRLKKKQSAEFELVRFKSVSMVDAKLKGSVVSLALTFETEQVNALKDANGKVVEGSPETIDSASDTWTFTRDMTSASSLWTVAAVS